MSDSLASPSEPSPQAGLKARRFAICGALVLLAGCATPGSGSPDPSAADQYWSALQSHCGKAYAGQLASQDAVDADFVGAEMVMHVRECSANRIAVPFHVRQQGKQWDRSRTWLFTRSAAGVRLKHDHRHDDGTSDAVTMYGGDSTPPGTAQVQAFPVDDESIAIFGREGLSASVTNVWSVAVDPAGTKDARFAYQLRRTVATGAPADRLFRVEFDLTRPVAAPPPPWGADSPASTPQPE